MTSAALVRRQHELRPFPPEYAVATAQRRQEILREWLESVDILLGQLDYEILRVRNDINMPVPWLVFVLGGLPRGARGLATAHKSMSTGDVLICNSTADMALCRKFLPNATIRLLPFAFNGKVFYPAGKEAGQAARTELGIEPDDRIVLYSGRLTIEKNVHTVLRAFRVVLDAVPKARLVIAGNEMYAPFCEFGTLPISPKRALRRLRTQLGLDGPRVMFIGPRTGAQLRDLYSTADVLLNLTLHHDENFGLAQVEAMACGLPVVGTAWGGLKDTIVDGVTGVHVPALVTPAGVKVDWWSAARSVMRLLDDDRPTPDERARCSEHARQCYSLEVFADRLDRIMDEGVTAAKAGGRQPLTRSGFADAYWDVCAENPEDPPAYRRGPEAMRLYRELITPYASAHVAIGPQDLVASAWWCLPAPLVLEPSGAISVNDPIFPFELQPPVSLATQIRKLVEAFTERPVHCGESLALAEPTVREAFSWLHDNGLVLRTESGDSDTDWGRVPVGRPALRMQRVDHEMDLVWIS